MNCFEARQDFRGLWTRQLDPQRHAATVKHLQECARCDAAFRAFALTAPVLYSEVEPYRSAATPRAPALARYREGGGSPAWLSMAAALMLFFAGASAAYFSVATPQVSLSDALSQPQPDPFVELIGTEVPGASGDFAG